MRKVSFKSWLIKASQASMVAGFAAMMAMPAFAGDPACAAPAACCTTESCTSCNDCQKIYEDAAEKLRNLEVPCGCSVPSDCCSSTECGIGCCGESSCGDCCCSLQGLFDDECGNNCFADHGWSLSGWTEAGITWNNHGSNDLGPNAFNNDQGDIMLNQVYFILSKDAAANPCEFGIGGQVDFIYGNDANDTSAFGGLDGSFDYRWTDNDIADENDLGIAMPQLFVSFYAPIGNGVTVDVGHFYTIIGYEVVTAPDNFFYSHAYTMLYGEPFTHTGVKANTDLTENLNMTAGIVTGWDDVENELTSNSFLGGLTWTSSDEATSLAFAIVAGDELSNVGFQQETNRTMYSIVLTQAVTEKLTYVFQHDRGQQDDLDGPGSTTEWYGINQYLFYDVSDCTRAGINYEWFRDDDGTQLGNGAGSYYTLRAGLNHSLSDCVMVRPEVRWDWADNGLRPYDDGNRGSQFSIGSDIIWTY